MQSHLIFSLISKPIIVISFFFCAAVWTCSGCGREEDKEHFTETGYAQETRVQNDEASNLLTTGEEAAPRSNVCVFVCGAVVREGVYSLPEGSRVIDAVKAAGGFSQEADQTYVNLAEYIYDTQRIEIPTIHEADQMRTDKGSEAQVAGSTLSDGRININHAAKAELMELPGIGESKAERIIAYRQAHGDFTSCEEIMNVSGIGEAMYENIKDHITVN